MSLELARAHTEAQARLRALAAAGVAAVWGSLPAYDEQNVDEWLTRALPIVLAAQWQSVALTDAFLARALGRQPLGAPAAELTGQAVRHGTPPEEVYRRPFVTTWAALKAGKDLRTAVAEGAQRATSTAEMDVQLASTHTARWVGLADDRITGYQRVTNIGACALCEIASTQRYRRGDLMPIHNRCGCTVLPIVGIETGQVIDPEKLQELKDAGELDRIAAQRQAARARKAGIDAQVREHGELGPVLVQAGDHFTSEADI